MKKQRCSVKVRTMIGNKDVGLFGIQMLFAGDMNFYSAKTKPVSRTEVCPRINEVMLSGNPGY
jgi:hypothetical protein